MNNKIKCGKCDKVLKDGKRCKKCYPTVKDVLKEWRKENENSNKDN